MFAYIIQQRGEVIGDFSSSKKMLSFVRSQKCPLYKKTRSKEKRSTKEIDGSSIKELLPQAAHLDFFKQARSKVPFLTVTKVVRQ